MHVFNLHQRLIDDYAAYITSFTNIRDRQIHRYVKEVLSKGLLWPEPLIQLSPSFEFAHPGEPGEIIHKLVKAGPLHPACSDIFRKDKHKRPPGDRISLYKRSYSSLSLFFDR